MNLQQEIDEFLAQGGVIHEIPTPEPKPRKAHSKRNRRVTTAEAARIIRVTYDTMSHSRGSGKLLGWPAPKSIKGTGRSVLYYLNDIESWKTIHGIGQN